MIERIRERIGPANKAAVALILPVVVAALADILQAVEVAAEGWLSIVIGAVITALGVYEVPNKDVPESWGP